MSSVLALLLAGVPLLTLLAAALRRFRRSGSNEVETFGEYVFSGLKFYALRRVRRRFAAELTLRQYAKTQLQATGKFMLVPAADPVQLRTDDVFVPLLLEGPAGRTVEYRQLLDRPGLHSVVIGDPGSGKSSLMKHLFRDACRRAASDPRHSALPLILELSTLDGPGDRPLGSISHTELLSQCLDRLHSSAVYSAETTAVDLRHGPGYLMMLDGLDEVPHRECPGVIRAITNLAEYLSAASPSSSLLVSTRTQQYVSPSIRPLEEALEPLRLQSFRLSEIFQFLGRWPFDANPKDEVTRLFSQIRRLPSLTEMCRNPLALAMFVARDQQIVGDIRAQTRTEFYAAVVDELLLDRRPLGEGAHDHRAVTSAGRSREIVLGEVCLAHLRDPNEPSNSLSTEALAAAMLRHGYGAGDFEADIRSLAVESGLFTVERRGETYRFLHLTFCEFLAARHLVTTGLAGWDAFTSSIRATASFDWASRLGEVVVFACGLADEGLRRRMLTDLADDTEAIVRMKAVIEARAYDEEAILDLIASEGTYLRSETERDVEWYARLAWFMSVLRDHGGLSEDDHPVREPVPAPADFLFSLMASDSSEMSLVETLARNDAEAAVTFAESTGDESYFDAVAKAGDDFSVLIAILARCEAGNRSWKQALVSAAMATQAIARVLVASTDVPETASGKGWSRCYLTRDSVYGYLLDAVLEDTAGFRSADAARLEALRAVRPPRSQAWTALRPLLLRICVLAAIAGVVITSIWGATDGLKTLPTLDVTFVIKHPLWSGLAVAVCSIAVFLIVRFLRGTTFGQLGLGARPSPTMVRVGPLEISLEHVSARPVNRKRRAGGNQASHRDPPTIPWREPVLLETLNLDRAKFKPGLARIENGANSRLSLPRFLAGIPRADLHAFLAARATRRGEQK
jgi:NACHT domain-containing protein